MKRWLLVVFSLTILIFGAGLYFKIMQNPSVLSVYDQNFSFFERFLPLVSKDIKEKKFEDITKSAENKIGAYGIYIKVLHNNRVYEYNKDELFYGASLYKVPIAVAAYKEVELKNLTIEDKIKYQSFDTAGGTGTINKLNVGTELSIDYIIDRLLKDSDNTAQNMLSRTISKDQISSSFGIIPVKNYFYVNNTATPYQFSSYFEELMLGNYLNLNTVEIIFNKMSSTYFDDRIHAGLNEDIKFSHKIGNWGESGTWHDCGVASKGNKKAVVCVMSRNTNYKSFLEVTKDVGEFVNILF